jgi:hypothetical protein
MAKRGVETFGDDTGMTISISQTRLDRRASARRSRQG